jgi:hypothetical protein
MQCLCDIKKNHLSKDRFGSFEIAFKLKLPIAPDPGLVRVQRFAKHNHIIARLVEVADACLRRI